MSETNSSNSSKKSPYIFIAGNPGSGKSTLMASIFYYINHQEKFLLRYDLNDKKGIDYLKNIWQDALIKGEFPPHGYRSRNALVKLSIASIPEKLKHNLTFFELPGEAISVVSHEDETNEDFNRFIGFISKADLILLTVAAPEAHGNDLSNSVFLQTFEELGISTPIVLVISKWDQIKPEVKDICEFVKSNMPATYKWLKGGFFSQTQIFKFSVGEVYKRYGKDENGKNVFDYTIKNINTQDSGEIFNWIFQYFRQKGNNVKRNEELERELKTNLSQLSREPGNTVLLEKIKDIYLELGEKEKAAEVDVKLGRLVEKKEDQFNLGKHIKIRQIEIHDLDFFGDFQWEFQPGVNVLLGRNGYGKSQLLRLLAALLRKDDDISAEFFEFSKAEPITHLVVTREDKSESISRNRLVFEESIGRVPVLAIPDLRSVDRSKTVIAPPGSGKETDLSRQWCYHFLQQKPVEGLIQDFLYQLCIAYLDQGKTFDLPIFQLIHNVVGKLSDQQFKFHKIETTGQAWFKIEVITEGNPNPMPIQKASQGTLSVLSIFGLIYSFLKSIFKEVKEKDLTSQPAIVLIDEIDAHLHPSWQQRIIGLLREYFPGVQFVVTAHSPLVVAGCKEGEVAVLRKAGNGFIVKRFEQDFIGCEAAELYDKVFEIEEKDDSYLYYNALYPFRGEIETEIQQLEKEKAAVGEAFSKEKEEKLYHLYDDLYYSGKANEKREKRREYSRILLENRKLKAKIKKLEVQSQAVK
jgi:predicted ATPase